MFCDINDLPVRSKKPYSFWILVFIDLHYKIENKWKKTEHFQNITFTKFHKQKTLVDLFIVVIIVIQQTGPAEDSMGFVLHYDNNRKIFESWELILALRLFLFEIFFVLKDTEDMN